MPDYYDSDGRYVGRTDSDGNSYDADGHYTGHTDKDGNHYDADGHYTGHTDRDGNHYDSGGSYTGHTDRDGNRYDSSGSYTGIHTRDSGGGYSSYSGSSGGGFDMDAVYSALGIVPYFVYFALFLILSAFSVHTWLAYGASTDNAALLILLPVAIGTILLFLKTDLALSFAMLSLIVIGIVAMAFYTSAGLDTTINVYLPRVGACLFLIVAAGVKENS